MKTSAARILCLALVLVSRCASSNQGKITEIGIEDGTLIFATMVNPGPQEVEAVIMARSIRDFAGRMSRNHIWAMVPGRQKAISEKTRAELDSLGVRTLVFPVEEKILKFPLATKVYAAATAERLARDEKSEVLVWMDSDNIVIGEPAEFELKAGKDLGCRPVMLQNISSPTDSPANDFWKTIYKECGVTEVKGFELTTTVDQVRIRAQFNAGLLAVRPGNRLLERWKDNFEKIFELPELKPFYRKDPLYAVFVHQAVLAATVMAGMKRGRIIFFSEKYNYPLMLHERIAPSLRSRQLEDLITLRYDEYRPDPDWLGRVPAGGRLREWLDREF